ncbi:conserved exported hypothetical protein [Methylocella tundrae]|uniref:Thiol:disulfide interchange protein DsbD N-terminal domain-containing protein n=1 Tax=Methylocella tundrae TaxID=227605 RepID=A0A8B6M441_METTU|nr:protein-disulfide reductase DsbD domain-containing protein [Methylocella tundrae]VTZ49159.1 conserved exported hypothetical protein [Methylocella tundrae]
MQMSLQLLNAASAQTRMCAVAALFALGFMAELRADPITTDWIYGKKSAARLIAAPGAVKGAYKAGVEIRLDPDALTYWRTPGETGVPPVFDFHDSENLKEATVQFPTPLRIDEAGLDAFGYRGMVTFPVDVTLADENRPAVLSVSIEYAVCAAICLPVKAKAKLELPAHPGEGAAPDGASPEEAVFAAAKAKVPQRLDAAGRDAKILITRDRGATLPTWRVQVRPEPQTVAAVSTDPGAAQTDLFVEGQEGWYFESKKGEKPNEFLIVEVEGPKPDDLAAGAGKIPVTLTLAGPRQSYEFAVDLGAILASP